MNPFYTVAALTAAMMAAAPAAAAPADVAGLAPHRRPANAPRVEAPATGDKPRTLYGIPDPAPPGLNFVRDQGAWYTPFDRPGMPPPYDLRGWYAAQQRGAR